jgi:hypothetical protein
MNEMDVDTEDDATPHPRKHQKTELAHLTQSDVDSEDDEPFKTPSVLVRKKGYQKIVDDSDEESIMDKGRKEEVSYLRASVAKGV